MHITHGEKRVAIRFRKSFKIAPGVKLNVSKSGVSTSVGGRGLTANLSKRGTRLTTSIPGSGLSASKLYKSGGSEPSGGLSFLGILVFAIFMAWLFFR